MPQKSEYIDMPELKNLCIKLVSKFPEKYASIPLDRIKFYAVTNRERPNAKAKSYNFMFLPEPIAREIEIDVACVVFLTSWASLADKNKVIVAASALNSLQFDGDHIKSKGYDMQDHKELVELFGVDYENSPDIPDILGLEKT